MSEERRGEARAGFRLDPEQRLAWLRLIRSENVGPVTFRALINRYGSASRALEELPELARKGGARGAVRIPTRQEAEREMAVAEGLGARFVAMGEPGYPAHLRALEGPPPLIAVRGGEGVFLRPMVAVVGARNASIAGRKMAGWIAREAGQAGYVVVSGLARGIDAAAHEAALDTGTIAVLAGGLDKLYPPENAGLHDRIIDTGGAVISEMPFGWDARARDFPRRNRIVSGLSLAVVLVEAAARSGSLHTARFALEQGREVLAVPGSPLDPRSEGANRLIRDGATLICHPNDVIEALAALVGREPPTMEAGEPERGAGGLEIEPGDNERLQVIEALGPTPVAIDEIVRATGVSAAALQLMLLELELAGRLERHRGGKVSLVM